jgi:serine/threonine-protein kinase RsbW
VIRISVPGSLRYRDLALRAVAAACKLVADHVHPFAAADKQTQEFRDFSDQVVSAFGEAYNNAALHSYRAEAPGDLEVEIEVGHEAMTIRMLDYGTSFNLLDVPDPDLDSLPESGLGIFIIRSFMDDVSYRAGAPNVLSMTKHYSPTLRLRSDA